MLKVDEIEFRRAEKEQTVNEREVKKQNGNVHEVNDRSGQENCRSNLIFVKEGRKKYGFIVI